MSVQYFQGRKSRDSDRIGRIYLRIGNPRAAMRSGAYPLDSPSLQERVADAIAARGRGRGVEVWLAEERDGSAIEVLEDAPSGDLLEIPGPLFRADSEFLRFGLFEDDGLLCAPPARFNSSVEFDVWADEACRRAGSREALRAWEGLAAVVAAIAASPTAVRRRQEEDDDELFKLAGGPDGGDRGERTAAPADTGRAGAAAADGAHGGGEHPTGGGVGDDVRPGVRDGDARPAPRGGNGLLQTPNQVAHGAPPPNHELAAPLGTRGGAIGRARANIAALRLLHDIEAVRRYATAEERATLADYVGWGGIPEIFDDSREGTVAQLRAELQELVSAEDYEDMAASTLNAHYTSVPIVQALYEGLAAAGYDGNGRVLEPSSGIGHFIGAGPLSQRVDAVEKDGVTARIAHALYPQAAVHNVPFEKFREDYAGCYDVVVGNPPFGRERLFDPHHRTAARFSIHNYFITRSIEALKPGGLGAFVVSRYFLDARNSGARQAIHETADFVGAVRLPETAFLQNANTQVVADVVLFRRRAAGELPPEEAPEWLSAEARTDAGSGLQYAVNSYFESHPENVLGEVAFDGTHFQGGGYTVRSNIPAARQEDLGEAVAQRLRRVWEGAHYDPTPPVAPARAAAAEEEVHCTDYQRAFGGYVRGVDTRKFYLLTPHPRGDVLEEVPVKGGTAKRLAGLMRLRDALRATVDAETTDAPPTELMHCREKLNAALDAFVAQFSDNLHAAPNVRLLRRDPSCHLVLSLLSPDRERQRAPILDRRVIYPHMAPREAKTLQDAIHCSFGEYARLDIAFCADLLEQTEEEVTALLYADGLVFRDPETDSPIWHEEYLSGEVRDKLDRARAAAEGDIAFEVNVAALEAVQPAPVTAADIFVQIGSPWVPPDVFQHFLRETLGSDDIVVRHSGGDYYVTPPHELFRGIRNDYDGATRQMLEGRLYVEHGTSRMNAIEVAKHLLNSQQIIIYDRVRDGDSERLVKNPQETIKANERADALRGLFGEWVFRDPERRWRLVEIYNRKFNGHRLRHYDGSHLHLPGMEKNSVSLRPHQLDCAYRAICEQNVLADHVVGAGKTFMAIVAAMEKKRIGLARKSMIVVPNHLVGEWTQQFLRIYPNANVLAMEQDQFARPKRQAFLGRIVTGDWDAVICPHSSFGLIPVSKTLQLQFMHDEIAELQTVIDSDDLTGAGFSVKQKQRQKARLEAKLKELNERPHEDNLVTWENLGIDNLIVDEAHLFKNLYYHTSMRGVAGLGPPAGSKRGADLYMKTRQLQGGINGSQGSVMFLTGTPISNTIAEMFHLKRYLAPDMLRQMGIHSFDAWAKTYAEVRTEWEVDLTGTNFVQRTRFARFANIRELSVAYRRFSDVVLMDDLHKMARENRMGNWAIPRLKGDAPQTMVLPRSLELGNEIDDIVDRLEKIRNREVDPSIDNALKCLTDAKLAALDMRIRFPAVPYDEHRKSLTVAREVARIFRETGPLRGVQLIFCDLSTPKGSADEERMERLVLERRAESGDPDAAEQLVRLRATCPDSELAHRFDVYHDIKSELVAAGVPEEQIRFIHEAKTSREKSRLYGQCQRGEVRVLMGSTERMGTGMNVQDRLVALHHVDAPWRPSDLEQREGRILRQNNQLLAENPEFRIEMLRYATERTADPKVWQALQQKAGFIGQLRQGVADAHEIEDIAEQALSYAEVKALAAGNPLVLEELTLTQSVKRLERAHRAYRERIYHHQDVARTLDGHEERALERIAALERDVAHIAWQEGNDVVVLHPRVNAASDAQPARYDIADDKTRSRFLKQVHMRILEAFDRLKRRDGRIDHVADYRELVITARPVSTAVQHRVVVEMEMPSGNNFNVPYTDPGEFDPVGLFVRIRNHLSRVPSVIDGIRASIETNETNRQDALRKAAEPFADEDGLDTLCKRLDEVRAEIAAQDSKKGKGAAPQPEQDRDPSPRRAGGGIGMASG